MNAALDRCGMTIAPGRVCTQPADTDHGELCRDQQPPTWDQRCACTHRAGFHSTDNGRPICWGSSVCGCLSFRPVEVAA